MSRQQTRPPPASQIPASARQNEYFVPRDGIDREVITSDICRYLGNDALVRPGTYESSDGRVTQGYFITAYRNLTSAMIQDLKADSARWEQERRAASRTGGGAGGSRGEPRGQDYLSWKNRQLDNNSPYGVPPADRMDVDSYPSAPSAVPAGYPGAPYGGAPAGPGYPPAPYPAPVHGNPAYGQPYGYPPGNPPTTQYSPGPQPSADRYPPPIAPVYPPQETFVHGSNFNNAAPGYPPAGPPNRMTPMSMTSAPPSRGFSATAGGPYPDTDPYGGYGAPAGTPVNPLQYQQNPGDPVYGRAPGGAYNTTTTNPTPNQAASDDLGSPAGTAPPRQGYSAGPDPQYDEHQSPALPNAPTPTNGSQIPPPGQPPARRDVDSRERDRDRDPRGHRSHRSETDREDRHAAERARHRQHR